MKDVWIGEPYIPSVYYFFENGYIGLISEIRDSFVVPFFKLVLQYQIIVQRTERENGRHASPTFRAVKLAFRYVERFHPIAQTTVILSMVMSR